MADERTRPDLIDPDDRQLLALFARQDAAIELLQEAAASLRRSHDELALLLGRLTDRLHPAPTPPRRGA